MVRGTEKLVRKMAKGYERSSRSAGRFIAAADFQNFLSELVSTFSGICIGIRKDRGQGIFLSVMSADKRVALYDIRIRNVNARGLDRSRVRYSFTIENRDINLEFC